MKIKGATDLTQFNTLAEVKAWVSKFLAEVAQVVNGQLSLTDNVKATIISATFAAPNTEISVAHPLGRAPTGYLVVGLTVSMSVFDGTSQNDSERIYLRSSAAGVARLWVL